jgi:hypothetical protein
MFINELRSVKWGPVLLLLTCILAIRLVDTGALLTTSVYC